MIGMYSNKRIGAALKKLRKEKNLSQKAITKANTLEEICSIKTLQRIESGKTMPHQHTLNALLIMLNISYEEFIALVHDGGMSQFNEDFERIWDAGIAHKFEEEAVLLAELKTKDYCDTTNPVIAQAVLLIEGILLRRLDKNHVKSLQTFYSALVLTKPKIFVSPNTLDCEKIANQTFSVNEYHVMKVIAIVHVALGKLDIAAQIYRALVSSLENSKTSYNVRKKVLPGIYYNFSNTLIRLDIFEEVLTVTEKGLDFCQQANIHTLTGSLLANKASALFHFGQLEEATFFFRKAHQTHLAQGYTARAEEIKANVKTYYNIEI